MNAPSWSGRKTSRLWSARGDERCSPPRSDDYKDWSLMQLKREITQRQLKTNPRKRNKDAFVKVLLSNDQEQTQTHKQQTLEDAVVFAPTPTSELQNMYANSGDQQQQQQQNLYAGQQQDIYSIDHQQQQQEQQQMFVNEMDMETMQTPNLTPAAPTPSPVAQRQAQSQAQIQAQVQSQARSQSQVQGQVETEVQAPVPVAAIAAPVSVAEESEVDTPNSFQVAKRQKMEETRQERRGSENGNVVTEVATKATATQQQVGKGSTEYLRRKLSIQAARLEIEGRRLELENKREQRSSDLHAVQLALAQEQLKQAKMTTQKMKTDWMVEQLMQKKRLNDAGISQEDTATLGMYLS